MARRLLAAVESPSQLLPADAGHALRGRATPSVRPDAIEAALERVAPLFRASLATGREHGFLAYADRTGAHTLEDDAVGTRESIAWHWRHPDATVAYSFHTHPSAEAAIVPSGIDVVGALIRGDHLVYILTMDGRLCGWRFRDDSRHARAVEAAVRHLDDARQFDGHYVKFLYDAFDALRPRIMEPVYAARLSLTDDQGMRCSPAKPGRPFLSAWEAARR
ncbi:MAG: hypothetical protein QOE90_3630 [Thermoplasmata archaeon]|jgi:hypothetical protein|nr:hypothetical protein [Thermoplasmata archaeon]